MLDPVADSCSIVQNTFHQNPTSKRGGFKVSDKPEQTVDEVTAKSESKEAITRRESLKKIAVTAYAAPATVMLLTADRATAQSTAECYIHITNNSSGNIVYEGGTPDLSPDQDHYYGYTYPSTTFIGYFRPAVNTTWAIGAPYNITINIEAGNGIGFGMSDCYQTEITVTDANGVARSAGPRTITIRP